MDSKCDSDEVEFNLMNPMVKEMYAYMQQHFNKQPMRTSMLTDRGYMDKLYEGNPLKCYEIFRITRPLLIQLMEEFNRHGYLRDG